MAEKPLGQTAPVAGVLSALYTVPVGKSAVCSTLVICNQGASRAKIRVSLAIGGAADTAAQYLRFDLPLEPNDGVDITEGWTLAATDVLRVYSDTGAVSFNLFGTEN